jgi:hypothetical protein
MLASVVRIAGALLFIACINASPVPIPWLIAVAVAILMIGYHGKAGQSDAAPRQSATHYPPAPKAGKARGANRQS